MICRYKIKFISDIEQKIRKLLVNIESLPSWECGLKSVASNQRVCKTLSLPSWECGLKLTSL